MTILVSFKRPFYSNSPPGSITMSLLTGGEDVPAQNVIRPPKNGDTGMLFAALKTKGFITNSKYI